VIPPSNFIGTDLTFIYSFQDRLGEWCISRLRNDSSALDLLRGLFIYDPERRLTAKHALFHRWFQEEPRPTWKYVIFLFPSSAYEVTTIHIHSAFQTVPSHQIPQPRRITQDEAPSMMPMPQNTLHQAAPPVMMPFTHTQSHSKPGSSASFGSLSGGGHYQGQTSSGNPVRKKARLG